MKVAYQNLCSGMDKPKALRAAQLTLREMTAKAIQEVLEKQQIARGDVLKTCADPDEKLLAHPYHWAGMQCVVV
jgi:CHAT domain-containing protein